MALAITVNCVAKLRRNLQWSLKYISNCISKDYSAPRTPKTKGTIIRNNLKSAEEKGKSRDRKEREKIYTSVIETECNQDVQYSVQLEIAPCNKMS